MCLNNNNKKKMADLIWPMGHSLLTPVLNNQEIHDYFYLSNMEKMI